MYTLVLILIINDAWLINRQMESERKLFKLTTTINVFYNFSNSSAGLWQLF